MRSRGGRAIQAAPEGARLPVTRVDSVLPLFLSLPARVLIPFTYELAQQLLRDRLCRVRRQVVCAPEMRVTQPCVLSASLLLREMESASVIGLQGRVLGADGRQEAGNGDDAVWGLGLPRGGGAFAGPGRVGAVTIYKAGDGVSVCVGHPVCTRLCTSVPQYATPRLSHRDCFVLGQSGISWGSWDRPDPPGLEAGV